MNHYAPGFIFLFFFSGFASLVYQVVWTRMAFARSASSRRCLVGGAVGFHAGAGRRVVAGRSFHRFAREEDGLSAAVFYAGAGLLIGLGAFACRNYFAVSERIFVPAGQMIRPAIFAFGAGLAVSISVCVCMGTTFPVHDELVREQDAGTREFQFSLSGERAGRDGGISAPPSCSWRTWGSAHALGGGGGNFTVAFISACWVGTGAEKTPVVADESKPKRPAGGNLNAGLISS